MGTKGWLTPVIDVIDMSELLASVEIEPLEPMLNLKDPPPLELNCTAPLEIDWAASLILEFLEFLRGDYRKMFEE